MFFFAKGGERLETYNMLWVHKNRKQSGETYHFVVGLERIVAAAIYNVRQEAGTGICGAAATTETVRKEEGKMGDKID